MSRKRIWYTEPEIELPYRSGERAFMRKCIKHLGEAIDKGLIDHSSVTHAFITHQKWCGALEFKRCFCEPDLMLRTSDGHIRVAADGTIEKILIEG